ncbi:MAG: alpha/beta hydrolase [Planctomycetota bacterium]
MTTARIAWLFALAASAPAQVLVREEPDLRYTESSRDPHRNVLDLYAPAADRRAPTVVFVHGGTWMAGDKRRHAAFGRLLAERGFAAALINYRLHPFARWPAPAEDAAAAVAYLRAHQLELGIDADRMVLCGHSAGGQIAGAVALDPRRLAAAGADAPPLRGFVGLSGIYDVRPHQMALDAVFGPDPERRRDASPIVHAGRGAPPTLLLWSERDMRGLDLSARMLAARLRAAGVAVQAFELPAHSHASYLVRRDGPDGALARALLPFLRERLAPTPTEPAPTEPGPARPTERTVDVGGDERITVLLPRPPDGEARAPLLVLAGDHADGPALHAAATAWAARGLAVAVVPCPADPAARAAGLAAVAGVCAHFAAHGAELGVDAERLFLGGLGGAGAVPLVAVFDPSWLGRHGLARGAVRGVVTLDPAAPADAPDPAAPLAADWIRAGVLPVLQIAGLRADPLTRALEAAGYFAIPVAALDDDDWPETLGTERDDISALVLGFIGL